MPELSPDQYVKIGGNSQIYGHSYGLYLSKTTPPALVLACDGAVAGVFLDSSGTSIAIVDRVIAELYQNTAIWSLRIQEPVGIDTDALGQGMAGCTAALDMTNTEAAIGYLKQWDNSAALFYNVEAASVDDHVIHQLYPDNLEDTDYLLVGSAVPFMSCLFDMSATVQTYTGDATAWNYWNGTAWSALTLINEGSDAADADGDRSFGEDGGPFFALPTDWVASTIDGVTAYWLQVAITDSTKVNVKGKVDSHRHLFPQPAAPFQAPMDGTITAITVRDEAAVVHTTADIMLVLMDLTKGTSSGVCTFPMDMRTEVFSPLAMGVDSGDVLALFVVQEDGVAEMGPLTIEMQVEIPVQS